MRMEQAVASYVKGQLLVSLIIGMSVGLGLWVLGVRRARARRREVRAAVRRVGGDHRADPVHRADPRGRSAGAVRSRLHPLSAIWVVLLFLCIQQLEGHVVVPKVMGRALRLHPLLVIFGLLAGGEIYGFPGVLVALPLLAAVRAAWEFFSERVALEPWTATTSCPSRSRSNRRGHEPPPPRAAGGAPPSDARRNLPADEHVPGHPAPAPAPHRRAARARGRDAAHLGES